jgi:YVTN family beta-propeller protein
MMRHVLIRGRTRAVASICALGLALAAAGVAAAEGFGFDPFGTSQVGDQVGNRVLLPSNQWIAPVGDRIQVNNGRITSSSLSPDGTKVAALTWQDFTGFLSILDLKSGRVLQQVGTGAAGDPKIGDGTISPDGPLYSRDGTSLWLPQSGDLARFKVNPDGTVAPTPTVTKLSGPQGRPAIPSGMALSDDGSRLYVALNANNSLGVINTTTNALDKEIPVGNAPRQVVITGGQAFVSNEGGRRAAPGEFTNDSFGTPIVADRSTGGATTGTLSVVDLASGSQSGTIPVGLQPTALFLHGTTLFVANSNDDSVSVVDTQSKQVKQTFNVNPVAKVGSYPNAITMPDDHHILVSVGRDNAVAQFGYTDPITPVRLQGLLPTDWYPVNVVNDQALGKIVVTNDKGIGSRGAPSTISEGPGTAPATGHNTYNDTGSVTSFQLPSHEALGQYTHQVFANNAWTSNDETARESRTAQKAIPASVGERSKIKHVFLIVKENRTYDQVLGDIGKGNSAPSLAQFGATVTPNQHALANRYSLFDNFYDVGTLSADGHNWLVQADANDYVEKEFGAFTRSYPAEGGDPLAYQRNGFLWNAAQRAGRTAADFGEYAHYFTAPSPSKGGPTWSDWYKDSQILEGKGSGPLPVPIDKYKTYADIPSVNAILDPQYPQYALQVPDQYRVDIWERAFKKQQTTGRLPNLTLLRVPQDHTSGITPGQPYPTAMVADNDLATGRIISDISHSRFWKDSAIFVLEDDPQNGVDHVDGHRSTLMIASPYAKRGVVNSHYYSQINVVRTIEQILGIPPMNQEDRAAVPMYDAFTNRPDLTPYTVQPNQIPLTLGVSPSWAADTARIRAVPSRIRSIYAQWIAWSKAQHFVGPEAGADRANPAQLNRLDWYAATKWRRPYPGDSRILAPNQVPGRARPAAEIG